MVYNVLICPIVDGRNIDDYYLLDSKNNNLTFNSKLDAEEFIRKYGDDFSRKYGLRCEFVVVESNDEINPNMAEYLKDPKLYIKDER